MKRQFLLSLLAMGVIIFCLSSCQKNLQDINNDGELGGTPLPGEQTYCRIESIWEKLQGSEDRFRLVLYDQYENPVAITTPLLTTGVSYHQFRYDQWHRLKDHIAYSSGAGFQRWDIYGYDNSGRIAFDTVYWFGSLGERPTDYWFREFQTIGYDAQNRINRVNYTDAAGQVTILNYEYDAAGNLIHPASDGVTYDNKINLNRTNDIWMFLARDYSVNNPYGAVSYNNAGYPTKMSDKQVSYWIGEIKLASSELSYGCRQAFW
jgi:YD repeat-containing protein